MQKQNSRLKEIFEDAQELGDEDSNTFRRRSEEESEDDDTNTFRRKDSY